MSIGLELRKFDMSSISDDSIIVVIGKRNTGKSFLVRDLLYYHQDIPVSCVLSPTEKANGAYSKMIPKIFIHDEYNPTILSNFMKRQKGLVKRIEKGEIDIDKRANLIFDDCLYDNSWQKDKNVKEVFMNGRHYGILYILTMQYPLGLPPILRNNIDYVILLRDNIVSNRKRVYDNYAGMFPTLESFSAVMDALTEDYGAVIIHNGSHSNKIEDQVFWYKAEHHEDFKLGPKEIWDYCDNLYSDSDSDDDININTYAQKKKNISFNIKKI